MEQSGSFHLQDIILFDEILATVPSTELPGVYIILTEWVIAIRGGFVFAVVVHGGVTDPAIRGYGMATLVKLAGHDETAP